jgi:hypothetical protein
VTDKLAAAPAAAKALTEIMASAAEELRRFAAAFGAKQYAYPIPFRCSAECGRPIRLGEQFVQTSKDWRPLERAHAACIVGRKGIEPAEPQSAFVVNERTAAALRSHGIENVAVSGPIPA